MEVWIPVDVNLGSLRHFSTPFQSVKFNIHVCMGLFFEVVSKCNTCCQSWKEPQKLTERNRDTAFRSIIKLCYKCQPSGEMEFMHTYYYQGNSKGSAYPLAWKQYCLFFLSSTYSKLSNLTRKKITSMHCNLWGCSISNSVLCPTVFSKSGWAKVMHYLVLDAAVWLAWWP